jgi:hypothetical protein
MININRPWKTDFASRSAIKFFLSKGCRRVSTVVGELDHSFLHNYHLVRSLTPSHLVPKDLVAMLSNNPLYLLKPLFNNEGLSSTLLSVETLLKHLSLCFRCQIGQVVKVLKLNLTVNL